MRKLIPQSERTGRRAQHTFVNWFKTVTVLCLLALVAGPIQTGEAASPAAPPNGTPAGEPQLAVVALTTTEAHLSWTAPADGSGAGGYAITRNGQALTSVDGNTLEYSDTGVEPSTTYVYQVEAIGATGPGSHRSVPVRIKTPAPPENADTMPPAPPEDLMGSASPGRVDLEWGDASDDTDVSAYIIRRDGQVLAIVDTGTRTYADTTVQAGQQYAYTVEAVDVVGHHSRPEGPFTVTAVGTGSSGKTQSETLAAMMARAGLGQPETLASTTAAGGAATAAAATAAAVSGFATQLKRYPYLTDTVGTNATVNFATDRSATTASVQYGKSGVESCTAHTVSATKTNLTVNSVLEYQWKAKLPVVANTQYCYRVYLGTTDLLGTSTAAPQFWSQLAAGSTQQFTFAVFGDWGSTDSSGNNANQANLMAKLAASGARFAVSTGDNGYPSGSQTNYGDLAQKGANISGVFGPSFWAPVGASMPLFAAIGNHGFPSTATLHPHLQNWPQDTAVSSSGGRYQMDTYSGQDGTTSASYPSTWYAFDAGVARFYVLEATWADNNLGTGTIYKDDYDYHWALTSAQYTWLKNDLAAHSSQVKFAFLHYPLYSDNLNESSDTYLQGSKSVEGLLNQYKVSIAFEGHSHNYQRFNAPSGNSVITHLTGGGGASLTPIDATACNANLSFTVYAIGWSSSTGGKSCPSTVAKPTSAAQVFHFLLVTVNGSSVTVKAINSQGTTFDQHSYTFH